MKNHPACNTPLVRALRKHFKGNPTRWKVVYNNLKVVYDQMSLADFTTQHLHFAFIWRETPQGHAYWCDLDTEFKFFSRN